MAQTVRGGRAALNRLHDELTDIRGLIDQMRQHALLPPNIRLLQRNMEQIDESLDRVERLMNDDLSLLLQRRENAGASALDEALARLADVEARLAILERSHVPEREKRG